MAERNRRRIAVLIYSMVNAVLFGIGFLIVLLMPPFKAHLGLWIPIVVVAAGCSLMLSHRPSAPNRPNHIITARFERIKKRGWSNAAVSLHRALGHLGRWGGGNLG